MLLSLVVIFLFACSIQAAETDLEGQVRTQYNAKRKAKGLSEFQPNENLYNALLQYMDDGDFGQALKDNHISGSCSINYAQASNKDRQKTIDNYASTALDSRYNAFAYSELKTLRYFCFCQLPELVTVSTADVAAAVNSRFGVNCKANPDLGPVCDCIRQNLKTIATLYPDQSKGLTYAVLGVNANTIDSVKSTLKLFTSTPVPRGSDICTYGDVGQLVIAAVY